MNLLFSVSWSCLKCNLNWKIDRFNQHVTGFESTHTSLLPSLKNKIKSKGGKKSMS